MRKAHCRLRAIGVFFQTMIEKREGFAKSAQGLKPARILDALRGAEAPLFHGAAGFRGGPHFHGGPLSTAIRISTAVRGFCGRSK